MPLTRKLINKNKAHLQRKYRKVKLEKDYIYPVTADKYCIFLHLETFECMIYEHRPEICRLYGTVPELQCIFIDMEGRKRTEDGGRLIAKENERTAEERIKKWMARTSEI